MTADSGLLTRLRTEIDTAPDADACYCAGAHLIACHLHSLLTESEYDVLYARLVQHRRDVTVGVPGG